MKRWLSEDLGNRYIDAMLSLSRIAKEKYDEATMLASYSDLQPTMTTLEQVNDALEAVKKEAMALEDYPREYITGMSEAMICFARVMQGDAVSYQEQVKTIQQLDVKMIPEENFRALEEKIAAPLGKLGYKGQIGEMIAAYINDTAIAPAQVTSIAKEFLAQAKADTLSKVIDLPPEDGIDDVRGVTGVFWSGFSRYDGNFRGELNFNLDRPWSRPLFANILCHEGYPGHQTFYCRWDQLFLNGHLPLEGAFYAYNTPTNALFEGGPEVGLHFLGWDDLNVATKGLFDSDKESFVIGRDILDLQRMYQTNACYLYNVQKCTKDEAVRYMTASGILTELEANNVYRFFTHPVQATYYPCYYYGKWMIYEAYEAYPKDKIAQFFKLIYDTPQTTNTFIKHMSDILGKAFVPFDGK